MIRRFRRTLDRIGLASASREISEFGRSDERERRAG